MLNTVLTNIADALNDYIVLRERTPGDKPLENSVVVSPLLNQLGEVSPRCEDKIVMVLVNIAQENVLTAKSQFGSVVSTNTSTYYRNAPVWLNLDVLFIANFNDDAFGPGLSHLSHVISFFQQRPALDASNTPGLHPNIEKLHIKMESLSRQDQSFLWGAMGAKLLPSALCVTAGLTLSVNTGPAGSTRGLSMRCQGPDKEVDVATPNR